jgi:hypothetical protein
MRMYLVLGALSAGLALCGCSGSHKPPADVPPSQPAASPGAPPVGLNEGNTAPEIVGEDQDGKTFKLSDYRGKVVLLDFWGNW